MLKTLIDRFKSITFRGLSAKDGIAFSSFGRGQRGGAVAAVGLAISAFSTIKQIEASNDAAKGAKRQSEAAKKAEEARSRQSEVEAQRLRIQQAREGRIRRAQVISATGNEGLGFSGTSGSVGAISSITSQIGSNIGFINQKQGFANEISGFNLEAANQAGKIAQANAKGASFQALGNVGDSIFQSQGGFKTLFGGNTNKGAET